MKPTVSVIIPVYNAEGFLDRCLESIEGQSLSNIEIIVINDGSIDNSDEICRRHAAADDRIRYFVQQNSGVSVARNRGLKEAAGEWVTFVDSDDRLNRDSLQFMYDKTKEADADLYVYNRYPFDVVDGGIDDKGIEKSETSAEYVRNMLLYREKTTPWANLYRASLARQVEFPVELNIGEDLIYCITFAVKSEKNIIVSQTSLYYQTMNDGSLMHTSAHREVYDKLNDACDAFIRKWGYDKLGRELDFFKFCNNVYPLYQGDKGDFPKECFKALRLWSNPYTDLKARLLSLCTCLPQGCFVRILNFLYSK